MSKVKKVFQPIIAALQAAVAANPKVKVADVLSEIEALAEAQTAGGGGKATTFVKDEAGKVVGLRCFYFQKWFDPEEVEVGTKANTASGYNSMCKVGLNQWTKQQRVAKDARDKLLDDITSGAVTADQIAGLREQIEADKNAIIATDLPMFDTPEELAAHREARLAAVKTEA